MFGEAAGHKCRRFLMPDADKLNFALSLAKRLDDRIDTVANDSKNMRNTPADQRVYQDLCCGRVACRMTRGCSNNVRRVSLASDCAARRRRFLRQQPRSTQRMLPPPRRPHRKNLCGREWAVTFFSSGCCIIEPCSRSA